MTRRPLLLFALAWLWTACAAPVRVPAPEAEAGPKVAALRSEAGLVVVDVELATADGWRATPLVLDLGGGMPITATADVLEWAATRAPETGPATRSATNARGDRLVQRRRIAEGVRLAGYTWRSVELLEAAWHPAYAPPLRLGIVGWPLVASLPIEIDLARGSLSLGVAIESGACLPLVADDRGLVATFEVAGEPVEAILDTAATATIVTREALAGTGQVTLGGNPVEVGERHFASLSGLPAEMLIGVPFFAANRVAIDAHSGCLVVEPVRSED